jgi:O-antigen/teichoic acid export membrane protein
MFLALRASVVLVRYCFPAFPEMSNLRRSIALSFAQRNSTLLIQFLSSLVIARLLSPHEIGIFAIGSVIVSFSHIVRDLGVSNYLIQERELTPDRIRAAQSIVLLTSWTIALALAVLAGPAAIFYSEPGVALTMRVLAISFVLLPIGAVTVALLNREMAFGRIYLINVTGAVVHNLTAIVLAWTGHGFISLAWAAVAGASVTAIGSLICRRPEQSWLPGFREWRRVFAAGTKLSGASFFYEVGLGGPELITGRALGFEAVAYFSRAFGAASMVLRALVDSLLPVAIPYFAKQARSDSDMKTPYIKGLAYMSVLSFPAFLSLAVLAEPLITLLYGQQWLASTRPMQILCMGLACLAVTNVAGSVLVGAGLIGTNLRMQAFFQPLKVVLVLVGAPFGLLGVATGVAVADISLSSYCIWRANRHVGATLEDIAPALLRALVVAVVTALMAWLALHALDSIHSVFVRLLTASLLGGLGWLIALFAVGHPLRDEFRRMLAAPHKS